MQRTNLKVFRTAHKLRQTDIAYELGVSRATYSFIERGLRGGTAEFWRNLQRTYNIPDAEMWLLQKLDESENGKCETKEN